MIKALRVIIPAFVRRSLGGYVWWLWADADIFDAQFKADLEVLEQGKTPGPGIGQEEEQEHIRRYVQKYFGSFQGLKVLGAGCGSGRLEAWMGSEGADSVCLDRLPEAVKVSRIYAERTSGGGGSVIGDLRMMPFRDSMFDLVNNGGVLEHFIDLIGVLKEYYRVTRPGGVIIASVPNLVGVNAAFGLKPFTELFLPRSKNRGFVEQDFSATRFRRSLEEAGFECLDISPTLFNVCDRFPFRYARAALQGLRLYDRFRGFLSAFGRKYPGIAFGYSFMIALARKPAYQPATPVGIGALSCRQ
ncbi:MAG: class I SAM-dependent methyltransferase [Dehalococcoidia bacterium]|nr:class I SAM-dependent methyltransferase [Dehalococcoidia bacterium]